MPSSIERLCEKPSTPLSQYKDSGVKVIGYTCSYVPEELIISAGLQPYRITNIGADISPLTPSFVCPFASATLENIIRLEDFFSALVLAHTCDPMWRLYDILKKKTSKPLFLLRVPHNTDNKLSLDFFRMELLRFKTFLEENLNVKVDHDALVKSLELCNESRDILRDSYMLNSDGRYQINGSDRLKLVLACMWMPKLEFNARVKGLSFDNDEGCSDVRLHVNGTAIYDLNLIETVEESGGFISSDDLCTGSRYFWSNVEKSEDPLSALSYRYLRRTPCPSQNPLEDRLEYINFMITKFKSQGVITFTERFCDPILYDSVHIRNILAEKAVPTMVVEYENPAQEIGRIKTRVEAFIESIGG